MLAASTWMGASCYIELDDHDRDDDDDDRYERCADRYEDCVESRSTAEGRDACLATLNRCLENADAARSGSIDQGEDATPDGGSESEPSS